ncbi:PREDICTED: collagen alpha-6(VI) chain-like [Nanorana parkeri]|uniref:collagen alpha-6(VI) chain-like n=1 Tax=Nanorana parkeri TaxID=125878 RepID=UPI000854EA2B|nr:PREDICTED: collagen alpha-6(VI) chain-like [Nanorana parkeri]
MKFVSSLFVLLSWMQLLSTQDTEIPKYGDLIILVDSSDSMGLKTFNQLKSYISRIIAEMQIGVDHYRIGLIQYNEDIHVGFSLSEFKTKSPMMNYIKNRFLFQGRSLMTGNALQKVHEIILADKHGRDKSKYPQVLLVITSGSSNDEINPSISTLKQDGIRIITVGVKEASLDEMQAMATSPQLAFKIANLKDLNAKDMVTTIQEVVEKTYYVEGTQTPVKANTPVMSELLKLTSSFDVTQWTNTRSDDP